MLASSFQIKYHPTVKNSHPSNRDHLVNSSICEWQKQLFAANKNDHGSLTQALQWESLQNGQGKATCLYHSWIKFLNIVFLSWTNQKLREFVFFWISFSGAKRTNVLIPAKKKGNSSFSLSVSWVTWSAILCMSTQKQITWHLSWCLLSGRCAQHCTFKEINALWDCWITTELISFPLS